MPNLRIENGQKTDPCNGEIAQCKVDWLSFTIPMPTPFAGGTDAIWEDAFKKIKLNIGDVWAPVFESGKWQLQNGRGAYRNARLNDQTKVRLSIGDVNADIYVEVSGQACQEIRRLGIFYDIFQEKAVRVCRIDLASDFECEYSVWDIIDNGYKASIKSRADYRTVQGDTAYIGSRKSERMLRIYRYHEPHPRAKFLRFEVEIKGDTARAIAPRVTASSCSEVALAALKSFGLKHSLPASACCEVSTLESHQYDKAKKGRMRWIMTQVLPALFRAHREGDIDARVFFETHLFSALE